MISNRKDCRGRKCTTVLHGAVCHRTSTPYKSGKKMKRFDDDDVDNVNDVIISTIFAGGGTLCIQILIYLMIRLCCRKKRR